MPEPVYDLVLGNIEGLRSAEYPDLDWKYPVSTQKIKRGELNAVETRAQQLKQNKKNTLVVPVTVNKYTANDLVSQQSEDDTLPYIRDKSSSGEVMVGKNGSTVKYIQKNGLYYRQFTT